jgi:phosphoribosylformylglycinamidine synthase
VTVNDGASPETVFADERVAYCLRETFDPSGFALDSFLEKKSAAAGKAVWILELGPRLNFTTAWSTNAVSILRAAKVTNIPRIEVCHLSVSMPHRRVLSS